MKLFHHSALSLIWFCAYYFDICLEIAAAAFAMSLTAVAAPEMMRFRDFCHRGCYYIYDNIVFMTMVMPMMRRWRQRVGLRCFTSRRMSRLHVLRGVDDCNVCCEVVWWCSCETCFSCRCCVQYCDVFLANAFMWSGGCVMIAMLLPRFAVVFSIFEFVRRGPHFVVWKWLRASCCLCYCLWWEARVFWIFWGCWRNCDDLVEGFLHFVLDCLKWACVLVDVITTEFQLYNLLHVSIALFALQMTWRFTNNIDNCNRVLFVFDEFDC